VNPKHRLYLIVFLAVTNLASGVLVWSQYRESSRLRAADLQNENAREDLQKRLWALEKRQHELDAEIAGLRARSNGNAANADEALNPDGAPGRAPPGRFDRRTRLNNLATLLDNPEFNKLWNSQQKMGLDSRYCALFKSLNLSTADLEKFKSLLVDKQNAAMDVLGAAREQGLNPRDPADRAQVATLLQNAQAQVDNNIRQTLGDAQFAQYQNYEQTLPQRSIVNQLTQSLSYTSSPLQDSQAEQLVNILAANAPARSQGEGGAAGGGGLFAAMGGGGGMMGGPFGNRSSPITDAAITQAQSVLTATQVSALQQLQAQQQAQRQLSQIVRQTMNGGSAPPSSGTSTAQSSGAASPSAPAAPSPPGG